MPKVQCIYCDKVYDPRRSRGRCDECGREHPPGTLSQKPGAFHVAVAAERMPGRRLTLEELQAQRQASNTLFSVAFLYLLGHGLIVLMLALWAPPPAQPGVNVVEILSIVLLAVPVLFALLGWWARYEPLAPAVLGLILYTGVALFWCVLGGVNCIDVVVTVLIFIALIRAVQAAVAARQARRAPTAL